MKAAFIYNFSKFVHWPAATADKTLAICVLGKDPFGPALEEALLGKRVDGRELVARRLASAENAAGCNVLFVSSSEEAGVERILNALHGAPVLTIGDMDQFAERGGMINLTTQGGRIRFEINLAAIERTGLRVSSQLLKLARIVSER